MRGEAFASWVDRVAAVLEVPPGVAARALGLECRQWASSTRPLFFGVTLTPASLGGLRDATGLRAAELRQMQLDRYAGTVLDLSGVELGREASLTAVAAREWMMPTWSRACPPCLKRDGVWPLWWRLGIAAACPLHRCLLVDVCPRCGVRLLRGSERVPRGLLTREPLPAVGECANRPPHGPRGRAGLCRQPLAEIPVRVVPESLVDLQRRVLAVADGAPARIAGERVGGADWFAALRYLTALARLAATGEDVAGLPGFAAEAFVEDQRRRAGRPRGGGGTQLVTMPVSAAQALAALALADRVLGASRTDAAGPLASWIRRATAQRRAVGGGDPLRHLPRPAVVARMTAAVTPRPSRVAGALPTAEAPTLEVCHIPHLADPGDYRELMARHLLGTAEVSGRRLTALALARLAGAGSWREAAAALEMDACRAARAANTLVQRIADPDAFWTDARTVIDRLHKQGLVNYAARRAAFGDLREIPHRALTPIFHPLGRDVTWQRQRHAAAWVWQYFTAGDVREAPAYALGWEDGTTTSSVREGWRRFHTNLPAQAEQALAAWGMTRLARKGSA
ncbi:TniQ family protein [Streptomyces sp. NPDC091215]|uniref:TniQ family protein n=1 Tax=Streptomyces sp. NPDC091215 TaxID=3155192 RepID=UPI0034424C62